LKEKLGRFFFLLENRGENIEKISKNVGLGVNVSEKQKTCESISQNAYKFLKLENILITSKQLTKRTNHYRINYLDKYQNSGFFFLDSYYRDKKEVIQPNLFGNFLLSRGYKYQFFYGFG
jgi:biotin-(acetyl-CoA carboxylase) ligase